MATYEELIAQQIVGTKEAEIGNLPNPLVGGFGGDPLRGGKGASEYLKSFKPDDKEYTTGEIFKAGFEQENATYNLVNAAFTQHVGEWDEEYNPFDEIEGTKYEIYQDHFLSAYNQQDAQRIKDKIDREEENRKILASSGALGVAAGMTAAVFDLPNLIPVGGVSYKLYKGGRIAQAAATGAIGGAVSAGVAEGVLQSTQELRTGEESVYNIAGATVLGGILGGAAGGISKIRFNKLAKNLEKELQPQPTKIEKVDIENKTVDLKENIEGKVDEFGFIKREGDAGAAFDFEANFKERFQEYGFGGNKAAQTAFQATKKLNPMLRIFDDPIAQSKETMLKLVRTNLQTKGVAEGLGKPTSVENALTRFQSNLGMALEANKKAFIKTSTNKLGARFGKGFQEFNKEVSKAIRQGKHENPEIESAANAIRQEIFQKIGKEANDVGLFTKDLDVTKNPNYFPRFPDVPKIVARQDDFKKLIFDKAKERLIPSIKREFTAKQESLVTQINDVNSRVLELDDIFKTAERKAFDKVRKDLGLKSSDEELSKSTEAPKLSPLAKEAAKFDNVDDFIESVPIREESLDNSMSHRPTKTGADASNITQEVSDMGFPNDFYKNPQYYEDMSDKSVKESFNALIKVKGNPDAEITIYRASPKNELRTGDWVTLSKEYAKGESLQEGVKVHSFKVKAKEIEFAGDSINEFGYWGHSSRTKEQLTEAFNQSRATKQTGDIFKTTKREDFDKVRKDLGLKSSDEELIDIYNKYKEAKRTIRTTKPKSLFQFIKENGGIQDRGGELQSRDFAKKTVGLIRKDRFQMKVVGSKGSLKRMDVDVSMDAVTQRAWEAGYFPEFQERPSINDLLEKIDQQLSGEKVYSEFDLDQIEEINRANNFFEEMDDLGIDPDKIKEAILTGKTGGFEKIKETKTKTDLITEQTITKEKLNSFSKTLLTQEKEKLKAKKTRLEKKFDKIKDEYEELFGTPKDTDDIVKFSDGTSKTRAQILEDDYAKEIAKNIFDKYRGIENQMTLPYDMKIGARGPAKSRTLNFVTDDEIADFVEQDITKVASRYVRTMGADIEIKKRFDDLNLDGEIEKINKEYDLLESKTTSEKERLKLDKQRKETIKIIEMFRDLIRGTYKSTRDIDGFFKQAAEVSRSVQYLSKMGDVTRSSFADIAQPIFKHGLGRVLKGSIQKLITDTKTAKKITKTNKIGGQVLEPILNTRNASLFDVNNPYSQKSSFMNFLDTMTANFSNLNLMNYWNNIGKDFSGFFTHQRVINNVKKFDKIKPAEKKYLANLGIGSGNIEEIAQQLKKYGTKEGSVELPNLEKWDNIEAKNLYLDAVNLDIDSTIITKGVGDVPMWMNTEWGKTLGQFRSFAFAANQQVFLAGLQRSDAAAVNGMIALITAGMMVYYMKTVSAGKELSDDPMVWLIEGIDRSGINPILMEANGLLEPFGLGVGGERKLSRYASRNFAGSLAGPTFGALQDVGQVGYGMISGDLSESDQRAARRNIPYQNLIWLRLLEGQLKEK